VSLFADRQIDTTYLPAPWPIWIEAGLSLWRQEFNFGAIYVGVLVEKSSTGTGFSLSIMVLPCQ